MEWEAFEWYELFDQDYVVRNRQQGHHAGFHPTKAVLAVGCAGGDAPLKSAYVFLSLLVGDQRVQVGYAKRSFAAFRLRKGDLQHVKATLRGSRLSQFLALRTREAFAAVRDFEYLEKLASGISWNYSFPSVGAFLGSNNVLRGEQQEHLRPALQVQRVCENRGSLTKDAVEHYEQKARTYLQSGGSSLDSSDEVISYGGVHLDLVQLSRSYQQEREISAQSGILFGEAQKSLISADVLKAYTELFTSVVRSTLLPYQKSVTK